MIDFSHLRPSPKNATRKQVGIYYQWICYFKDSRLSEDQKHERAAQLAGLGKRPIHD